MHRYSNNFKIAVVVTFVFGATLALIAFNGERVMAAQAVAATRQQAIDLAATSTDFAPLLKNHPQWQATAYDSHNSFQVWHVEFHDGAQDLGSADVSVNRKLVYFARPQSELSGTQRKEGEAAVQKFARSSAAVAAMIGKIPDAGTNIDYNAGLNVWALYFQQNGDAVAVVVQFSSTQPFNFSNPVFKGLFFPNVLSFADWQKQEKSLAVNVAFAQTEIAAAVRGHDGWAADATYNDDGTWALTFKADGQTLATATVNLDTHSVVTFDVTK